MRMEVSPRESVSESVELMLGQLRDGELPSSMTVGVEIEGALYTGNGCLFHTVTVDGKPLIGQHHTEYMTSTLESATPPVHTNSVRDLPRAIMQALSTLIVGTAGLAQRFGASVVYSSTFEGGSWEQLRVSPSLEIQQRGKSGLRVLKHRAQEIPNQTVLLYRQFGIELSSSLADGMLLPWPAHAVHIHTGVTQSGDGVDARTTGVRIMLRSSVAAKVMSFALFNTNMALGVDLTTQGINADARAVFRRLAPTSRGFFCPRSAAELARAVADDAVEVRAGKVTRVTASASHDRARLRLGPTVTVESVDGAMTPDLRKVIAWVLFQVLLDFIALEAILHSRGDEEVAIRRLGGSALFRPLPTVGPRFSAVSWDDSFNRHLWLARAPGTRVSFRQLGSALIVEIRRLGRRLPAMSGICNIVAACLAKECREQVPPTSALEYLGIREGEFLPGLGGIGPLSLRKAQCDPSYLVHEVGAATLLQAGTMANVRDAVDAEMCCG